MVLSFIKFYIQEEVIDFLREYNLKFVNAVYFSGMGRSKGFLLWSNSLLKDLNCYDISKVQSDDVIKNAENKNKREFGLWKIKKIRGEDSFEICDSNPTFPMEVELISSKRSTLGKDMVRTLRGKFDCIVRGDRCVKPKPYEISVDWRFLRSLEKGDYLNFFKNFFPGVGGGLSLSQQKEIIEKELEINILKYRKLPLMLNYLDEKIIINKSNRPTQEPLSKW